MNPEREQRTVDCMIAIYCRGQHSRSQDGRNRGQHGGQHSLCAECRELRDYAHQRIERCPFQAQKPVCSQCRVHCYAPAMRARIRQVMRYAGPRMLFTHPILTVFHLLHRLTPP